MKAGLTVSELIGMLESGACTAEELTLECLDRIARLEPTVGAFLTVDARGALAAAAESDRRRHAGALLHPMDGFPLPSRTTSAPAACAPPAARGCLRIIFLPMMRRSSHCCGEPAACCSAS